MQPRKPASLILALLFVLLTCTLATGALAAGAQAPATEMPAPQVSSQDVRQVIATLENEKAREQLIRQLTVMLKAMEAEAPTAGTEVATATAELLRAISARTRQLASNAAELVKVVDVLPGTAAWLDTAARNPEKRWEWIVLLGRLAAILGSGYLTAWLVFRVLVRPRRVSLAGRAAEGFTRFVMPFALLLLDAVPIAVFALTAYLVLAAVDPNEESRLVALAWINASIIVRVVLAAGRFIFSPDTRSLRLVSADDETSNYLQIWLRRISGTAVFGYFGLQSALLLGLRDALYHPLLHLLGFLVLVLLLIFIVQNRSTVAGMIRGEMDEARRLNTMSALRRRLSGIWHIVAAIYLVLLYGVWAIDIPHGFTYILRATALTLVVLAVTTGLLKLLDALFRRGLSLRSELNARFPGLEKRVNRYFPALQKSINALVYLVAALALLEVWGVDTYAWVTSGPGSVLGTAVARIVGIIVASLLLWEVVSSVIERYLSDTDSRGRPQLTSARTRTLLNVARNALLIVITIVSTLMVLSELGVNIAPLLAGAGVIGLAVGFGAQRLVQDVITGVFILFQDLMAVGDVVKLGDTAGLVESLSIRTVRLRDLSGTVHTIPFSAISTVSNLTEDFSFYVFDLGIAYREDVDTVIDLLREIGKELRADGEIGPLLLDDIEIFGVDAFGDSAVVIKGRLKTLPIKQWTVGRAFNRLVKIRFDEAGVEIPFPHRTLYFGEAKDGTAPAARVQVAPGIAVQRTPHETLLAGRTEPQAPQDKRGAPHKR
jgi:small-conductance mechanosensitive channel